MTPEELKAEFASLKPVAGDLPWSRYRRALRDHMRNDVPSRFLRWSTIQATMFVGEAPYVRQEYDALKGSGDWPRWEKATRDSGFGGATPLSYDPGASGNLVNQAFHLLAWEEASGQRVDQLESVVEIGGGYGAMCLICRRLGFTGSYAMIDEPELVLLQRYYLEQAGVEFDHAGKTSKAKADLFVASFTLTELTRQQARGYLGRISARHYLIVDGDSAVIDALTAGVEGVEWEGPVQGPHPGAYWFGKRKAR